MSELSLFWQGITTGDAGPYSDDVFSDWIWRTFQWGVMDGVVRNTFGEYEVNATSPATAQIRIFSGSALIQGRWVRNTGSTNFTIAPNSSGNPRIDAAILRVDFNAQTVRMAILQGTPNVSPVPPTLTQTATVFEIYLAFINVANAFVSIADTAIIDQRTWCNVPNCQFVDVINNSAVVLDTGSIVIRSTTSSDTPISVNTTTSVSNALALGAVESRIAVGATGRVITRGVTLLIANSAVAVGDLLSPSTTAARVDNVVAGHDVDPIGVALTAASGAGSYFLAYIDCNGGLRQQPGGSFMAYDTANQVVVAGVTTLLGFSAVDFSVGAWFNGATDRFTPLSAGKYQVSGYVTFDVAGAGGAAGFLEIQKNGVSIGRSQTFYNGLNQTSGFFIGQPVEMNGTTDYLELYVNTGASGATTLLKTSRRAGFGAIKIWDN